MPNPDLSREDRAKIGTAIARLLGAQQKDNGRYDTPIGDKTPLGLYEVVAALMEDDPDHPRYHELFS